MQMKFSVDKHRIMSLEAKNKKENYLLMEMSARCWPGMRSGELLQEKSLKLSTHFAAMEKQHSDELY